MKLIIESYKLVEDRYKKICAPEEKGPIGVITGSQDKSHFLHIFWYY
jgi:hypothetical protein